MSKRRPALILEAVLPDQPNRTVSPVYAIGQLQRAMARAAESGDAADRERALEKARRWQDVLAGMADGRIQVGRRTPVADTPAWVTLEVAHGGFATGRYLAEAPLTGEEAARLAANGSTCGTSATTVRPSCWTRCEAAGTGWRCRRKPRSP
jgi:hypothetical protein